MSTPKDENGPGFTLEEESPPSARTDALPPLDFSTFVLSLATSAMFHMGLTPDPSSGEPNERNLPLARQTIDTLDMLQQKTVGNLDDEEAKLIQTVLYELRMGFVSVESK